MRAFFASIFVIQTLGSFAYYFRPQDDLRAAVLELVESRVSVASPLCGKSMTLTAVIKNRGDTVGNLLDVQKSCGCLEIGLTCPATIAPGESIDIPIKVRVPEFEGTAQSYGINFVFNAGAGRAYSLPLEIEVAGTDCKPNSEDVDVLRPVPDPNL